MTEFEQLLDRLKTTNQLLFALLSDPRIPGDQKDYIRSCKTVNARYIEGAERMVQDGK
jgi:hypothetical protein